MRKIVLVVGLVFLLLLPVGVGVHAQDNLSQRLATVKVALWPEFDQPSVLVIYHITLPAQVRLPAKMSLSIPSIAGAPNAVAVRQPNGVLENLNYDQKDVSIGWSILTFSATTPEIQIEYYDPGLKKDGKARQFEYQWPGEYAVDDFTIEVQQPIGASEMRISPNMGIGEAAADGMVYYTYQAGALSIGQAFQISFGYQKATDDLSARSVPVEAAGPLNDTAQGRVTLTAVLPWILGGLVIGLLFIVGGVTWYWQAGRKPALPPRQRRARAARASGAVVNDENEAVYCHQCGKRAAAGDRFCRTCGAELRLGS